MPSPIRVLHVDDAQEFAELTAEFLELHDSAMEVDGERLARDALDRLATEEYDCIVSDYEMPGMDGLEFLEAVREEHPDLPFVLFTGKGSEEIASEAVTAGVTDYLQKAPRTEQYQLLANRVRNAVEAHRAQRRAAQHARINTIINDVNQALVRARSRTEIETAVCDVVSAADPYAFAWIGAYDPETGEIVPRESAGDDDGYLDAITVTGDEEPTGRGPAGSAVRTEEIQVTRDVAEDDAFEPWREDALERGFRSVAAVPLVHDGTPYGILVVYADRPNAFDDTELALLDELAGDVAHALHAIDVHEDLKRHQTIIQASGDAVFAIDENRAFTFVNAAFEDLLGSPAEDFLGRPFPEVVQGEDLETAVGHFEALRADEREQVRFEVTLETAEGEQIPGECHVARLPSPDGFRGVTGIVRDVTHQKEREAELATQAEKIERLHDVATTLDSYDGPQAVYERIIAAAEDVLEFDVCIVDAVVEDKLVPQAVSSGVPSEGYYETTPIDAENNLAARTCRTGEPSVVDDLLDADADPATDAYRSVLTVPIGEYGVFQAVASDVGAFDESDLELAELLVAHGRQNLRRINREETLDAMHAAARALMDAGSPSEVCHRAVRTVEYVLGRSIAGIWLYDETTGRLEPEAWTEDADAVFPETPSFTPENSLSGRAYEAGELRVVEDLDDEPDAYGLDTPIRSELLIPLGDHGMLNVGVTEPGAFSEWEISLAQTFAANTETALNRAVNTQELADRRRALARQNERLEQFANLLSHDLRNPLNAATGRVQLAATDAQSEAVAEHLAIAREALDRIDDIIEDVLRVAHQGRNLELAPTPLEAAVRDAWTTTSTPTADLAVVDDLPVVRADRRGLGRVFENLFRNALEHAGRGVTITVGRLDDGFYVEDDGPGLPDVDRADLFDLGFSADDGTGFGLAIVDEISEAHGWRVVPATADCGGARFEFTGVETVADDSQTG